MYRVSPQLFVTSEHIISASASSSLSSLFLSLLGSGVAVPLLGLGRLGGTGDFSCGRLLLFVGVCSSVRATGVADRADLSARRFSRVPRSKVPSSSSGRTPESRMRVSMRARRFSRPSIYLALRLSAPYSACKLQSTTHPFGGCRFFSTCVKIHSVL